MNKTNGYIEAGIINAVIGLILFFSAARLGSWLLHPIAGILLAYIALAMSLIYFGWLGFRQIPVGSNGIQLILGERYMKIYQEGWVWNLPKPFGDIIMQSVQEDTLDVPMTEVLTDDNVPVSIDLSIQFQIVDLYTFFNVKHPVIAMKEAADSVTRIIVQKIHSENIAQEKANIPDQIENGSSEMERTEKKGLSPYALEHWGIKIIKIRITHIRLPKELEEARINVQVMKADQAKEVQQAIAETTEARHVASLIGIYKETGVGSEFAANIAQSERRKATRIIIDGSGSPLEKAGALAGGALNQSQTNQPSSAAKSGRRRENKEKE